MYHYHSIDCLLTRHPNGSFKKWGGGGLEQVNELSTTEALSCHPGINTRCLWGLLFQVSYFSEPALPPFSLLSSTHGSRIPI